MIHFTTIQSVKDNRIVNQYDMEWEDFVSMLTEPHTVTDDKGSVILINPYRFKTEDYQPVTDEDGNNIINPDTGMPYIRRCADNVTDSSMLFLDFDGNVSIVQAKIKFRAYNYIAYTSFSHRTKRKAGRDCFRLILKLTKPIPMAQLKKKRKDILKWIGNADDSTLDLSRSFYIPSCTDDMEVLSQSWCNEGMDLDWEQFKDELEIVITPNDTIMTDEARDRLLTKLKSHYVGYEPTWTKVAWAMYHEGYTFEQFVDVTMGGMMREKTTADCQTKWKAAMRNNKPLGAGFLMNVTKGLHDGKGK